MQTGQERRRLVGHAGVVWGVAISPDGRQAISGGEYNEIRLWDLESGKENLRFVGHAVRFVAFTPDGRRALSCSEDHTVRLWDVATGQELRRFEAHTDRVECLAIAPDGRYFLSCGFDGTLRLWDLPEAEQSNADVPK